MEVEERVNGEERIEYSRFRSIRRTYLLVYVCLYSAFPRSRLRVPPISNS